mmetsp:Transcript_13174/g.18243  ORF Transcript_13174/g.18243 Transcript_13174/m.18243 type:complete len:272 (+) Transcript_13174:171-986(+)|eukprot:CAMPEP_0184479854 /NCGR_PEP_ID=MMETSP0113_2-20130426/1412_1 /TAXON_ID=91329 /ORGANISM="Norrisiella sphaerica, Strain BC52" /LENGTH=271 /DNA_ID=CAMNT_0026858015 /DNA_START=171 /DNA_END=986 /DNA_ORIENTATION=+
MALDRASIQYFATLILVTVVTILWVPPVDQDECKDVSIKTFFSGSSNLKAMAGQLLDCGEAYKTQHPYSAILLYSVLYTAFLAASIPGCTTIMSILAGALYHPVFAIALIIINSSFGGMCAYLLSYLMLRETLEKRFPSLFDKLRKAVKSFGSNIWFAMIFLRVTPLVPNWFVSLGAPLVGMPLHVFFLGGMIGFIPAGIFHCMNGRALKNLVNESGVDPLTSFATLFGLQFLVLLPLWICGKQKAAQLESEIETDASADGTSTAGSKKDR